MICVLCGELFESKRGLSLCKSCYFGLLRDDGGIQ